MKDRAILAVVILLSVSQAAPALPEIPKEMSLKEFYDGFFPAEEWVAALKVIPREQRGNPYQRVRVVDALPEDVKARWPGIVILRTREDIEQMKKSMAPFLRVAPLDYIGLVPRRNNLSGNQRVKVGLNVVSCPTGDGGILEWYPDKPDRICCNHGHDVDPFKLFPPTGIFKITGPLGQPQEHPYHDSKDGKKRIFLYGEYMDPLRVATLSKAAATLGELYQITGDVEYAKRAAAILCDFALALPHWTKVARGYYSGLVGAKRFLPITDFRHYSGIWYDNYHSGLGSEPLLLARAYDFVVKAPAWDELDPKVKGDARAGVENDLFLYTVRDAIRYDIHHPEPASVLSNYIPYQIAGLLVIGWGVGMPELAHYAYWKECQLARKTLMADSMFPESPSYARQHVYGLARAAGLVQGYSDPAGFVSTIDGKRFDNLDMLNDLSELGRAVNALESLTYPDGENMIIHDTYGRLVSSGFPAPVVTRPLLYPAFGHAVLGRGEKSKNNQIQAHLHYSGNWGHAHLDMLNIILWACSEEMVSDIGYAHTYRGFANNTSGHNLVVVDRRYQPYDLSMPGDLVGWHPVTDGFQVVEVSAPRAYDQCSVYRRTLYLIPIGENKNLVLDIFDVAGGNVHEWMAQGSCMVDGKLAVSVPTEFFADSYADDGKPFTPPESSEYQALRDRQGKNPHWLEPDEKDPWYGVFRDVHKGHMKDTLTATFTYMKEDNPALRVHLLSPREADVYTCTVPSLRRCYDSTMRRENHSLVEKYRMPKLVVRRDGKNLKSRFVALWEPFCNEPFVASVADIASENTTGVALEIRTKPEAGALSIRVYYSPDPSQLLRTRDGSEFQGRYAAVIRSAGETRAFLYDGKLLRDGNMILHDIPRPSLPLERVVRQGEEEYLLELDGVWPNITPDNPLVFDEPEYALISQNGGGTHSVPIKSVSTKGRKTLLHCTRHPGFDYDPATGTLREVFTPFNTIVGKAFVNLPHRVIKQLHGKESFLHNLARRLLHRIRSLNKQTERENKP